MSNKFSISNKQIIDKIWNDNKSGIVVYQPDHNIKMILNEDFFHYLDNFTDNYDQNSFLRLLSFLIFNWKVDQQIEDIDNVNFNQIQSDIAHHLIDLYKNNWIFKRWRHVNKNTLMYLEMRWFEGGQINSVIKAWNDDLTLEQIFRQ